MSKQSNDIKDMKNQVSEIGVITYKQYEERVIIDNNFDTQALYDIMDNDPDFVSFHIEGSNKPYIYGTVEVEADVQIVSTTYNAYAKQPFKHKTKTSWNLTSGGCMPTKKQAIERADYENRRNRQNIEIAKRGRPMRAA